MPLASLLRDRFLTLLANGGDALDWSAIGQLAAKDAGEGGRGVLRNFGSPLSPSRRESRKQSQSLVQGEQR
jgi:hypothetical protein